VETPEGQIPAPVHTPRAPGARHVNRRHAIAATGGGIVTALALLGCEAPGTGAGKQAAPARISVITRGGGDGTGMEQTIIPAFSQQFPNIKVEHASLGGEPDYWAKVVTGFLGNELGDVVWASTGGFHALGIRGVFAQLDPLARADRYDFKDYVPAALDTLKVDGKLMGLPWGGHTGYTGLLYNEELLSRAGHKPPDATWTWDKLLEVAKTSSRVTGDPTGDVYGFHPLTDYLGLTPIVRGNGADFLDKEGKKVILGSQTGLASLNFYRDLWVRHRVAVPAGSNVSDLFVQGRLALWQGNYGTQFNPGETRIAGRFKWGMVVLPKGSTGKVGTQLTINGMAMSSKSKSPDAAWQFLKFIMEPDVQLPAILSGASRPGLRKSVLRHPKLMSDMKSHAVWVDLIETAAPWHQPANLRWAEFNEQINKAFAPAWAGEQTVEQALSSNMPNFDAILAKPREGFV
jgi:multiple sugar transport system substrate-binding protein